MKKLLIALTFLFSLGALETVNAQAYDSAVGVRLGNYFSGTYKKFISGSTALEGIVGLESEFDVDFLILGAFYEIHNDLNVEGIDLQWYYGFGGYVLLGDANAFGPSGIAGLEYNLDNTRFSFFLDAIPTYLLFDGGSDFDINFAFGARYILN